MSNMLIEHDRKEHSMNKDTFRRAEDIQKNLETLRKAYDAISQEESELKILWSESNYTGGSTDRSFRIRSQNMGEIRDVLKNHFESRIAELEKEFEAL